MLPYEECDMTHGRTIYVIIKKYGMQIDKIYHIYTCACACARARTY